MLFVIKFHLFKNNFSCIGLLSPFTWLKVAEHSFQEPMPNLPLLLTLLLSYLCFGARFLQESRLTTETCIRAFLLRCMLFPWQRGCLKTKLKNGFCLFKKIQSLDFFIICPLRIDIKFLLSTLCSNKILT